MVGQFAPRNIEFLVFYLYLLVRWQHVRRKLCYLVGAASLLASLLVVGILTSVDGRGAGIAAGVIISILNVVTFGSAIAACYGGALPLVDKLDEKATAAMEQAET